MLESPQDESVVRWGDQGDSFVVLEVKQALHSSKNFFFLTAATERTIHKAHTTEAF